MLVQVSGDRAKDNLQQASFNLSLRQREEEKNNQGSQDLETMCKKEDIVSNYREIYFKNQKSFHSSFIIVIMGNEKEVFKAESHIIAILKSESIEVQIPYGKQLEMFLSVVVQKILISKQIFSFTSKNIKKQNISQITSRFRQLFRITGL